MGLGAAGPANRLLLCAGQQACGGDAVLVCQAGPVAPNSLSLEAPAACLPNMLLALVLDLHAGHKSSEVAPVLAKICEAYGCK